MTHRHHEMPDNHPNTLLPELWRRYKRLKSERDELHAKAQSSAMSDLQQMVFETEKLEPIVREMDRIAMLISETSGNWAEEIRIKAAILLDYVEMSDGDVAELLAVSLGKAVLSRPLEHN